MKYKVLHSHVHAQNRDPFKRDDIVTKQDLTDAGHDVDFLLRNDAIEALPGTEDAGDDDPKKAGVKLSNVGPKAPNAGASPAGKS